MFELECPNCYDKIVDEELDKHYCHENLNYIFSHILPLKGDKE